MTPKAKAPAKPIAVTPKTQAKRPTQPNELTPDLETAIEQLVHVGYKDPADIVNQLRKSNGDTWLRAQAALLADDVAAQIARRILGQNRRGVEHRIRPDSPKIAGRLHEISVCIPHPDGYTEYKRASDCTAEDLRRKANFYAQLAAGSIHRAIWYGENADIIEAEGVQTWGEVPPEKIPPLPVDPVNLAELVA